MSEYEQRVRDTVEAAVHHDGMIGTARSYLRADDVAALLRDLDEARAGATKRDHDADRIAATVRAERDKALAALARVTAERDRLAARLARCEGLLRPLIPLDEDCGEPDCDDCEPWRPIRAYFAEREAGR